MNNKNILLFSFLLCAINTNIMPIGKKLEQTKQAWFTCKKRPFVGFERIFPFDCSTQEEAYNQAKKELQIPLFVIIEKGTRASTKLSQISNSWITNFFTSNEEIHKLKQEKLLAYAAGGLLESLMGYNGPKFESSNYNNKTFSDYSNDVIEEFVKNSCHKSTHASNVMGPLEATEPELEETKKAFRAIIEKN